MRHTHLYILLGLALLLGSPAGAANGAGANAEQTATIQLAQSNGPSLSEAVNQVRRQYRGRIVSAETEVRGNREVHVIKVLTEDGKLKTVR
ncbi:MAG: hypothetical protein RIA65_06460, partial [Woeseia sp.]